MGNALRFLCGYCQSPTTADEPQVLDSHGAALTVDLHHFGITSQVPPGLSQYVSSSKKEQASWYNKLLKAWNEDRPPPKQPEVVAKLVIKTLHNIGKVNLEGFLAFYGLPYVPQTIEEDIEVTTTWPEGITPPWPEGVQFELLTLPVDKRAIGDGDGFTTYVSIKDPRELKLMPQNVIDAIIMKENAHDAKDFKQEKLIKKSVIASGYRFLKLPNQEEVLARKYRIRLRGVDAPEVGMAYGEEARQMLVKMIQGKCLKIHVYDEDKYGRSVGDVYCNDIFIQEQLLKRGCVWHYVTYDRRPEFAKWQKEARDARRGLWALPDPEKPWEWRKNNPNPREHRREAPICSHILIQVVDAPGVGMAYGEEAKQVLVKMIQGKWLKIHVYDEDRYGRSVGNVYCNDIFIQEQLLKRDYLWHYVAYDRCPDFAKIA
ncbi:hypothetical protein IEQ34_009789 [Dendrobium chrysotoxum]|uniref:TNase-like domain-containing protein n=1 Tax=Dendrobium chrysotoxum TaxID=161865 RepID=A0AAV7H3B2_DENCH|nr:hypothetical protein IEQ34_009789 [Dendrobium chrysotoxum]